MGPKIANLDLLLKALPSALSSYGGRGQFSVQEQQKVCASGKSVSIWRTPEARLHCIGHDWTHMLWTTQKDLPCPVLSTGQDIVYAFLFTFVNVSKILD